MMKVQIDTHISKKKQICEVSIIINDFAIHGIKVLNGKKGIYLKFPSQTYPIKEQTRIKFYNAIIEKLKTNKEFIKYYEGKI